MIHCILNVGIKHIGFEKKHQGLKRNCITFTHNSNINDVFHLGLKVSKTLIITGNYEKFCIQLNMISCVCITSKSLTVITNLVCNLISATSW